MVPMMTIQRAAAIWSLSERRVNELCKRGRIEGAYKEDGRWQIPVNAKKPVDERYKVSTPPAALSGKRLPLPVGITDYKKVSSEYLYIDKTLLLKEVLDEKARVSLFTRPREFGKSLNLDMIKTFFEISDEDGSLYFRDKKIWKSGEEYRLYQGKYPVIFIDFRPARMDKWEESKKRIVRAVSDEFNRHKELSDSEKCSQGDKDFFGKAMLGYMRDEDIINSVSVLSKMLEDHYGTAPVIIMDEYDTPVMNARERHFTEQVERFFTDFYTETFENNRHYSFGFLAGIFTLSAGSVLKNISGLKINSILDKRYGEFFGFTEDETEYILEYFNAETRQNELKNWYGSYHFGDSDVYNPWSVINYFNDECRPLAFWEMTGNNDIIDKFLSNSSLDVLERLELMMQNKTFGTRADITVTDPDDRGDPSALFSYMLITGYLKATKAELQFDGDYMCDITLPNRELSFMYGKKILVQFESIIPRKTAMAVRESIYRADSGELREHIYNLIMQTIAFNAGGSDKIFYHGLVLGLCAMLGNRYYVSTDYDSGTGNFSIEMMPLEIKLPGILIMTKRVQR